MSVRKLNLITETRKFIRGRKTQAAPEVLIDFVDRAIAAYAADAIPTPPQGKEIAWLDRLYALKDERPCA